MGVTSYTNEITTASPPAKMFKALSIDSHNLFLKLMPEAIKSIEIVQGNGGVGTIEQTNFPDGFPYKYVKSRIDTIDKENLVYKYTIFEGDMLEDPLESIVKEIKIEVSGSGGSLIKLKSDYHTKSNNVISEEAIKKQGFEEGMGIYKAVDAHLLANPHF